MDNVVATEMTQDTSKAARLVGALVPFDSGTEKHWGALSGLVRLRLDNAHDVTTGAATKIDEGLGPLDSDNDRGIGVAGYTFSNLQTIRLATFRMGLDHSKVSVAGFARTHCPILHHSA